MSAESGVPTFRDANGLWESHPIEKVATPEGFQEDQIYLRTAVSVEAGGWAHFDYVKMPDYRWGIFLAPQVQDRKIHFGEHKGEDAWQEVPGEHRANLRRIIVAPTKQCE